jgi:hypothetical protein
LKIKNPHPNIIDGSGKISEIQISSSPPSEGRKYIIGRFPGLWIFLLSGLLALQWLVGFHTHIQ